MLGAPLIVSCDITKLDPFTFGLLSNDEVIEVDQDALGVPARKLTANPDVLVRPLEDGSLAVGLFNRAEETKPVVVTRQDLSIGQGTYGVRDLWRQKDIGLLADRFETTVPAHGVVLLKISKR